VAALNLYAPPNTRAGQYTTPTAYSMVTQWYEAASWPGASVSPSLPRDKTWPSWGAKPRELP